MDEKDKAFISELRRGIEKTYQNAVTLQQEVRLLLSAGYKSHALFLSQISIEECAKIEMMGWWAASALMGHDVDEALTVKALSSHANKNRTTARFLRPAKEENLARLSGDFKRAAELFAERQREFHATANARKNDSLYVNYRNGKFVAPDEQITEQMLVEIIGLNEKRLRDADIALGMIERIDEAPDGISDDLKQFEKRLKELAKAAPDDPISVLDTALTELLEVQRKRIKEAQK